MGVARMANYDNKCGGPRDHRRVPAWQPMAGPPSSEAARAVNPRDLSTLVYAQAQTSWGYHTVHRLKDVSRGSYWEPYGAIMDGDTVLASCADGTAHLAFFRDGANDGRLTVGVLAVASRAGAL